MIGIRIQRKRSKGWRMPPNTISVTRPGKFGNPLSTASEFAAALDVFTAYPNVERLHSLTDDQNRRMRWIASHLGDLRGHDLACWCSVEKPCHAQVLLDFLHRMP